MIDLSSTHHKGSEYPVRLAVTTQEALLISDALHCAMQAHQRGVVLTYRYTEDDYEQARHLSEAIERSME
jgi:hypothetical protein